MNMGPKTKAAVQQIVDALKDFPREEHRQVLEWADIVASGGGSMQEVERGQWSWSRTGTNHERAYPNFAPDWSK
jgi:hypothetical protein